MGISSFFLVCGSGFGFPFRVMFVIRHLFPEIRDEVPEKFRMAECFTAFAIWFSASPTKDGAASEVTGRRVSNV